MRDLKDLLKIKSIDYNSLIKYGFEKVNNKDNDFIFKKLIGNGDFEVNIIISNDKKYSKVIDKFDNEEYALVDVEDAVGEFVGGIRKEYESIIDDFIEKCTFVEIFKNKQTKELIDYIRNKYSEELEFPWSDDLTAGIWRNRVNEKWFGLLMLIKKNRLKVFDSEEIVEVLNIKYYKNETENIVNNKNIFAAYHMNKSSWVSILLDGSLDNKELFRLVDLSFELSGGKSVVNKESKLALKIYEYLTFIPKGKVVTYKQIAEYLGNPGLARIVGTSLHKNPDGDKYPCYKVLNSKGELAEAFVFGGKDIQKERLEKDGIEVKDYKVNLKKYQWKGK